MLVHRLESHFRPLARNALSPSPRPIDRPSKHSLVPFAGVYFTNSQGEGCNA
jgi:hypothetical protein